MTWLQFIAATLACFRLTRLITDDKITDRLRALVVREAPRKLKRKAKQGITCPFCVSFYIATLLSIGLVFLGVISWAWMPIWLSAIWGGSVLWNQVFVTLSK